MSLKTRLFVTKPARFVENGKKNLQRAKKVYIFATENLITNP